MKNIYFLLAASLFIASCGPTTVVHTDSYQPAPVEDQSYQSFYDQLSPYGNWISYPGYGYVWMPNAGPDFQPYATNGNWIYTEAGWTWASNYNWGWAPFHYGRWFYENGYGWMWVPGNEWAPAWVSWRGGGDYYGWAPMGPRVSVDVALNSYNPPANYWNFVPRQYMGNPNWHNYYVGGRNNVTIINNTTIINNYSGTNRNRYAYAPGPDPNEVGRYSGSHYTPVQIRQSNTPGARMSGAQYEIYQPRITNNPAQRTDAAGRPSAGPAPARYQSFNNVRPSAQYQNASQAGNTGNQQATSQGQPAYQRPPANNPTGNQPAYNGQHPSSEPPARSQNSQNPSYNPPANNQNQPTNHQPVNNQPVSNPQTPNNPRTQVQSPTYNPPANNPAGSQPVNSQQQNHTRTASQSQPVTPQPAPANNPTPTPTNDKRMEHFQKKQPDPQPAPTNNAGGSQQQGGNHGSSNNHPSNNHNATTGRPLPKPVTPPENKPKPKPPVEQ